jgi:hypothetical protein
MRQITCVLAILAAASTAAVAKDLKQEKKASAPTVSATQMTDAEMDKVTAGVAYVTVYGPEQAYVTIFNNGQAPPLVVYPPNTSNVVCVNFCFN